MKYGRKKKGLRGEGEAKWKRRRHDRVEEDRGSKKENK